MNKRIRWRWGLIAALAMTLLSLFPQFHLLWQRGSQWNGSAAFFYTDEPAYAAYVNALIDGRPGGTILTPEETTARPRLCPNRFFRFSSFLLIS